VIYDKINHHYKCQWEKIKLKTRKEDEYDKLIKISIDDWITYDDELNLIFVNGFTIINNIPQKKDYNKFKFIEIL